MRTAFLVLIVGLVCGLLRAQLPDGFFLEDVVTEVEFPVGVEFIGEDRMLVYNTPGAVYLVENEELLQDPIIDLREEVGFWGDHGLLSVVIHPQFELNGYIYLYYVVDRHHLLYHGTSAYDPEADLPLEATIARLIRLTLDPNTLEVQPNSKVVFIGDDMASGIPVLGFSHSGGTLLFGSDGTLLLSTGDGTWKEYNGTGALPEGNYDIQGLEDGIIPPEEHTGTWRSQQVDGLNGKILRMDPETGEGLPSNPYFESEDPSSNRSRVWSLGLRNPFRMTRRPLTGSSDPNAGDPGSLYIGDVGYWRYEELNVANGPAMNFGWPLYEGIGRLFIFEGMMRDNPYTPNPLSSPGQCPAHFSFDDLLNDPIASHNQLFPNPCDALLDIPADIPHFDHSRPVLTWRNVTLNSGENTLVPGFDQSGSAIGIPVEQTDLDIDPFIGSASLAGDFYFGSEYPEEYFGAYFHTDFAGWLKVFQMNEGDEVESVDDFMDMANVVHVKYNPFDESLYITTIFPGKLMKLSYGGNRPPVIELEPDTIFGSSPLTVQFNPSGTYDPDGDPLFYTWDLGDGSNSTSSEPFSHVYISPDDEPYVIQATLSVSDTAGNSSASTVFIALNNTPPAVSIDSLPIPSEYDGFNGNSLSLSASVSDQETAAEELDYKWRLYLHHNSHFHLEFESSEQTADFELVGIGCEGLETYWYRIELEVTDPQGLVGNDLRWLYPDCDSTFTQVLDEQEFILYPNPNQGQFTLRGPLTEDERIKLELFDSTGRSLMREERTVLLAGRIGISAEGLGDGRYFLRLESSEHSKTIAFIIQSP